MSESQPASLQSLEVPNTVLKKISSVNSMHAFNSMKDKIENMYQETKFPTSQSSLLTSLERFLKSINTMRHTVMIPSRLMDQQLNPKVDENTNTTTSATLDSLSTSMDQFCSLGNTTSLNHGHASNSGIYFTVSSCPSSPMPSLTCDQISFTNSACGSLTSSSSSGLDSEHGNMYQIYQMLMDAKNDLVWNHERPQRDIEHPLYTKFKYHLDSLNSLTAQFADLAQDLTANYEANNNQSP